MVVTPVDTEKGKKGEIEVERGGRGRGWREGREIEKREGWRKKDYGESEGYGEEEGENLRGAERKGRGTEVEWNGERKEKEREGEGAEEKRERGGKLERGMRKGLEG